MHFEGLPARICWLGYGERHRAGLRINELVRSGEVSALVAGNVSFREAATQASDIGIADAAKEPSSADDHERKQRAIAALRGHNTS